MARVLKIKNDDTVVHNWLGQNVSAGTYFSVPVLDQQSWGEDSQLIIDISDGIAVVNDGTTDITNVNSAINYLKAYQ